eukprot:TRINITY_DN2835_c0_g1_i3.p1 TRINITY_DN2835_c0_g1~~TRINITY_DN2835_c0_g1_i3.p1  ORF type:complete len:458 (+),score=120.68 TRINITY_DN2835_c0_g1_i3:1640-3013(+)
MAQTLSVKATKEESVHTVQLRPPLPLLQSEQRLGFRISASLIGEIGSLSPSKTKKELEEEFQRLGTLDFEKQWKQKWTLWFGKKTTKDIINSAGDYLKDVWPAGTFNSGSSFVQFWNQGYEDTCQPPPYSKIMVFKRGIKPVWEDPYNKNGGKFVVRISSLQNALPMFLTMTLRLLFGQLGDIEEFCGSILAIKGSYVWLQLWNRNTNSRDHIAKTKDILHQLFGKKNVYQVHKVSIRFQKLRKQNPDLSDVRTLLKKNPKTNRAEGDIYEKGEFGSDFSVTPRSSRSCSIDQSSAELDESFQFKQMVEFPEIPRSQVVSPLPQDHQELQKKVQEILDSMVTVPEASQPVSVTPVVPSAVASPAVTSPAAATPTVASVPEVGPEIPSQPPVATVAPVVIPAVETAVVATPQKVVAQQVVAQAAPKTSYLSVTNVLLCVLILLLSLILVQDFAKQFLN